MLLEQARYGCTSTESQARYALYNLAHTGDSKSSIFTMQHLSRHQCFTMRSRTGGILIQVCNAAMMQAGTACQPIHLFCVLAYRHGKKLLSGR